MRKERSKQLRIEEYYSKQEDIRAYIRTNACKNQTEIAKGLKIDPLHIKHLKDAKVLINTGERLEWSLKIPNSYVLAETMTKKNDDYYHIIRANKIIDKSFSRKRSLIEKFFNLLGYHKI